MKTNTELVNYAERALAENWGYCLGTYGQVLTPALLKQKQSQGGGVGAYNTRQNSYLHKFINKKVSDCYGLVKGYLWTDGQGKIKYVSGQDRNQEMAYNAAKEKGPLTTLPEIPGIILWMKGHAGIYIGNGEFIECAGAPRGTLKGKIQNGKIVSGSKFTHWFKDTNISYVENTKEDELQKAVQTLFLAGIIGSPAVWIKATGNTRSLILKMASYIENGKVL